MKLAELRRPEVEALDKAHQVAVIPLGSLEQHGLHLPLFTDSMIGENLAERVEAALPETVVLLPTLWLGSSHHHLRFPGTMSVPSDLYIEMVYQLCQCVLQAGFTRIFLLLSHGGNDVPCREALQRLCHEHRDRQDLWLTSGGWWAVAGDVLKLPEMETPGPTHACEYETSMILSLRPDLVDMPQAEGHLIEVGAKCYRPGGAGGHDVFVGLPFEQLTRTGALGKPELGTAQKGEQLMDVIANRIIQYVREFAQWERESLPPR